jgi:putative transposase
MRACYRVSVRRAFRALKGPRSTLYYRSKKSEQAFLRERIKEIAASRVRYGYRRIHTLLQREGWEVNHKRVHRLYREEGLQVRLKPPKRRVSAKLRDDRSESYRFNQCWSMDFMVDQLFDGRRLRVLTIVDNFSRVSPFIGVGTTYKGYDVVLALNQAVKRYGVPERIMVDNGSEFVSREVDLWAYANRVTLDFSRPGKPTDNAYIESFNGRFRQECLNEHWFLTLEDARQKIESWRRYYNEERPHSSLGYKSPLEYVLTVEKTGLPLLEAQEGHGKGQNPEVCPSVASPPRRSGRSPSLPYPPGGQNDYTTEAPLH